MMKTNSVAVWAAFSGLTAAFVAGCASIPSVGPSYEEPKFADPAFALPDAGMPTSNLTARCEYEPAASNADTRATIACDAIGQWWKRFNDPVLENLVESGVSNNVGYQMAQRRLEQANWTLLGTYAAFLPKFQANGAWARYWYGPETRSGSGNWRQYNLRTLGLNGSWEIDIFGGSRRNTEAALAEAEAAGWTVADAWLSLTTQIGAQYVNLRTTQERIEVARINLKLQCETYDILHSRLTSGIGDELALNQCAYIVEETRARIPQLLAEEEKLKNSLAILTGTVPGALNEALKPLKDRRDWLVEPQRLAELPLDMLRARPDVKASERRLAAQTARIGVAKAQWFPRFFVTGTVGWEHNGSTRLFSPDAFIASLGPSFSWPILQGGEIYANVKAVEAKTSELALSYALTLETAYGEVRDCYAAYTQEYHRNKALAAAVKAATDAVSISKDLYKNGLKDFNNVLDAQRSRLQYEESFAVSRGNITLNLIGVYKALGGGLSKDIEKN